MSIGGIFGAVAGGIVGFFIGGPIGSAAAFKGALAGGLMGSAFGMMIDPLTPDIKNPAIQAMEIMSNEIGSPIEDLLGTSKITGHLLCYGKESAIPQYAKTSGGKGGKKKK